MTGIWFITCLVILIWHWYSNGVLQEEVNKCHKKLEGYEVMYDQILMRNNLDLAETGEWGYMWLSDTGLCWTEFQPERCSSIYMKKDEFINKWSKVK